MRDIYARMPKVNYIQQIINKQFGFEARFWQVIVLIDIIVKKSDIYTIASTNASKSLIY